ncbi:hypothetical protein AAF712_015386, partial [Marasmius tenuissimus]
MSQWTLRTADKVREQVQQWCRVTTVQGQKETATQNGVQWTVLHDLPNWDPVMNVPLGFMHTFLEDILQKHLQQTWNIQTLETVDLDEVIDVEELIELQSEVVDLASTTEEEGGSFIQ